MSRITKAVTAVMIACGLMLPAALLWRTPKKARLDSRRSSR